MLKLIPFIALLLAACEDVPDHLVQADFIIDAYEATYGDVTEQVAICMYETPVTYPLRGAPNCCADFDCLGCTTVGAAGARVRIRRGIEPPIMEVYTIRHEYTHVLLWCMTRDMAADHQVPEFAFTELVNASGSLARYVPPGE